MRTDTIAKAEALVHACRAASLCLTSAESCTGGLIGAYITAVPGASHVYERGFITYSNAAKTDMLGVDAGLIGAHGAVSEPVARAMAAGALAHAGAGLALAVTGIAGPGGGSADKPVGLVHIAAALAQAEGTPLIDHQRCTFGDLGRNEIRERAAAAALDLARSLL